MYSEQCKSCIVEGCPDSCHVKQAYKRDLVEVVRCKDCKYQKEYRGGDICYRLKGTAWVVDDDFCSYAERRNDED